MKDILKKILFPPYCVICGKLLPMEEWENDICVVCNREIPFLRAEARCSFCGREIPAGEVCASCRTHRPAFHSGFSAFSYNTMQKSIARFKFDGAGHDGMALGRLMGEFLMRFHSEIIGKVDYMTEVPLHEKKERERGYNQSAILCQPLSAATGIAYIPKVLKRMRATIPQNEISEKERRENLKDAFSAQACQGHKILLIDDILTTGSTFDACAKALYRAGAERVMVFALSATEREF